MCNGTSIDPSAAAVPKINDFSLQNKMASNDWSLIMAEKSIYEACDAHSQCPSTCFTRFYSVVFAYGVMKN